MRQFQFSTPMPPLRNITSPDIFGFLKSSQPDTDVTAASQLKKLAQQSGQLLLTIRSRRFLLYTRSTLTVDENKINIVHQDLSGQTVLHSVLIENISDVSVECSLFNATLVVTDSCNPRFPTTHYIRHLRRDDAHRARRLIQGLVSAKLHNIDFSSLSLNELEYDLEKIGKAKFIEQV